ncbi:MAG: hypothetical protein WCA82_12570 [Jiangellales bacterium]
MVTTLVDGGEQVVVAAQSLLLDAAGEHGEQVVGDADGAWLNQRKSPYRPMSAWSRRAAPSTMKT